MLTEDNLNETLADAVMDRPREFFIGNRRYCLWSPTLGMSMMMERRLSSLNIDMKMLSVNPSIEALRLVTSHREEICHILSILSFRSFVELSNTSTLKRRARLYSSGLNDEELAQLFLVILSDPKPESIISLSGVGKEQEEQSKIVKFKNKDGHTKSFGGKTIYGTLIDNACKNYGWTKEYVVWGIDLISLRMMLSDQVNTIYLSDKDIKDLGMTTGSKEVYGMTQEDIDKLKAMDWD